MSGLLAIVNARRSAGKPLIAPGSKKKRVDDDDEDDFENEDEENATKRRRKHGGNDPVQDDANPEATFNARVHVLVHDRGMTKAQAITTVARRQPALHQAWLAAVHAKHQREQAKAYRHNNARRLGNLARRREAEMNH